MKFVLRIIFLCLICLFFSVPKTFAKDFLPVVTVINPIREPGFVVGSYPKESLAEQWSITHDLGIDATWLWQPTTLTDVPLVTFAKSRMKNQEFGLFMEVDRNFAAKARVIYKGRGPWYFSDGLFLFSYDQEERKKLIDTAFTTFYQAFGYYPKTVGSWWIDAYSLTYMHKKYGVIASLRAADQFGLDAYTIWGTPWSIPYVGSDVNVGVPYASGKTSSGVVMLQWAARDPLMGNGASASASTYSMQDYGLKGYDISYADYLSHIYLQKPLDNLIIGLEGGFAPSVYHDQYEKQLTYIALQKNIGRIDTALAKDYAAKLLATHASLPPTHYFLSKDFVSNDQSFWYISPYFEASIQQRNGEVALVTVKKFSDTTPEEFYTLPNSQGMLWITNNSLVDSSMISGQKKILTQTSGILSLKTVGDAVSLLADGKIIATFFPEKMQLFPDTSSQLFSFSPIQTTSPIVILILLYSLYGAILFLLTKKCKVVFLQIILLIIPLGFVLPVLFSPVLQFSKQEILLLPLLFSFRIPIELTQAILVTAFLILLFFIHFLSYVFRKNNSLKILFYTILVGISSLYIHIPYIPLDKSTYPFLASIFGSIMIMLIIGIVLLWFWKKSQRLIVYALGISVVFLSVLIVLTIFSRQLFVLNPFEIDALRVVQEKKQPVWYLETHTSPIYKAVYPLVYKYPSIGEKITNTKWQTVSSVQMARGGILFVPRYVGSDIAGEDIENNHLEKIFDNEEIALFEKR